MSCYYCSGKLNISERSSTLSRKGNFYPGIDAWIDGEWLIIDSVADTYEPNYTEAHEKINFCPMCGVKLKATDA